MVKYGTFSKMNLLHVNARRASGPAYCMFKKNIVFKVCSDHLQIYMDLNAICIYIYVCICVSVYVGLAELSRCQRLFVVTSAGVFYCSGDFFDSIDCAQTRNVTNVLGRPGKGQAQTKQAKHEGAGGRHLTEGVTLLFDLSGAMIIAGS